MKNLFLVFFGFSVISCTSKKIIESPSAKSASTIELTVDEPRDSTSILPISIDPMHHMKDLGDPYSILHAYIKNDKLWLEVSYSGGCKEHEFEMLFNNAYQEQKNSEPAVSSLINLSLKHEGNEDACRSIVQQNLRFDLKQIQTEGYPKLVIRLTNWEEKLIYSY